VKSKFPRVLVLSSICVFTVLAASGSAGGDPFDSRSGQVRGTQASTDWRARLKEELPLLGHRNWIAVVDSAYPLQISPGIETIETGSDHLEVVRRVLHEVAESKHVRPVIFTDAELKVVPEADAPGVTYYRDTLTHFLEEFNGGGLEVHSLPHEEIIGKLDEAGKTFHVLVLKTRMTIPYTSVFVRLDCGYWTEEQEKRLREKMSAK
jgi:hypothetical protein